MLRGGGRLWGLSLRRRTWCWIFLLLILETGTRARVVVVVSVKTQGPNQNLIHLKSELKLHLTLFCKTDEASGPGYVPHMQKFASIDFNLETGRVVMTHKNKREQFKI